MNRPTGAVCYDSSKLFKPEWAYPNRQGRRAESFILPFSFNVLANGSAQENYSWRLDDDVPYVLRAILFPLIGTAQGPTSGMLVRIRDCYGNPLTNCISTNDYVLAAGAIGQSGFDAINAAGFPLGCEIECEPGGVITFDFQIPQPSGGQRVELIQGTMYGAKLFEEC